MRWPSQAAIRRTEGRFSEQAVHKAPAVEFPAPTHCPAPACARASESESESPKVASPPQAPALFAHPGGPRKIDLALPLNLPERCGWLRLLALMVRPMSASLGADMVHSGS